MIMDDNDEDDKKMIFYIYLFNTNTILQKYIDRVGCCN